ncbi:MAG: MBL fold metallo-hydrolase [Tannerella sp.]|jgi:beta-lactamase superfamily II metal-dependent hydrolase|nr:MBL fold metallo-hydrolase [Tannerella sp.]
MTNYSRREFLTIVGAAGGLLPLVGCPKNIFLLPERLTPKVLPPWQEGFLDIHQICTGRGNSTFIIAPDGTTMLIDAGELGGDRKEETLLPRLPNASRTPGEWIAAYVEHFSKPLNLPMPKLDYVMLTHFHSDHIGFHHTNVQEKNGYALSGITMLAEHVAIGKLVDRGFPDYDFPSRKQTEESNPVFLNDYLTFVEYQRNNRNTIVERFETGSRTQFAPKKSSLFTVQNIAANGRVWDGKKVQTVFPREEIKDENMNSCVVKLSYGPFSYYSGGDCSGIPDNRDMESPVADAAGRVDVMNMDHHANWDTVNPHLLQKTRPQVMIMSVWTMGQPHLDAMTRMLDKRIYPDERAIFATGLHDSCYDRLGNSVKTILPQGHIVIRVTDKGKKFSVFVLDAASEQYEVKYTSNEFISKSYEK